MPKENFTVRRFTGTAVKLGRYTRLEMKDLDGLRFCPFYNAGDGRNVILKSGKREHVVPISALIRLLGALCGQQQARAGAGPVV